eukprot:g990.t1
MSSWSRSGRKPKVSFSIFEFDEENAAAIFGESKAPTLIEKPTLDPHYERLLRAKYVQEASRSKLSPARLEKALTAKRNIASKRKKLALALKRRRKGNKRKGRRPPPEVEDEDPSEHAHNFGREIIPHRGHDPNAMNATIESEDDDFSPLYVEIEEEDIGPRPSSVYKVYANVPGTEAYSRGGVFEEEEKEEEKFLVVKKRAKASAVRKSRTRAAKERSVLMKEEEGKVEDEEFSLPQNNKDEEVEEEMTILPTPPVAKKENHVITDFFSQNDSNVDPSLRVAEFDILQSITLREQHSATLVSLIKEAVLAFQRLHNLTALSSEWQKCFAYILGLREGIGVAIGLVRGATVRVTQAVVQWRHVNVKVAKALGITNWKSLRKKTFRWKDENYLLRISTGLNSLPEMLRDGEFPIHLWCGIIDPSEWNKYGPLWVEWDRKGSLFVDNVLGKKVHHYVTEYIDTVVETEAKVRVKKLAEIREAEERLAMEEMLTFMDDSDEEGAEKKKGGVERSEAQAGFSTKGRSEAGKKSKPKIMKKKSLNKNRSVDKKTGVLPELTEEQLVELTAKYAEIISPLSATEPRFGLKRKEQMIEMEMILKAEKAIEDDFVEHRKREEMDRIENSDPSDIVCNSELLAAQFEEARNRIDENEILAKLVHRSQVNGGGTIDIDVNNVHAWMGPSPLRKRMRFDRDKVETVPVYADVEHVNGASLLVSRRQQFLERIENIKLNNAAVAIQSKMRARLGRKRFKRIEQEKTAAAGVIQRKIRGRKLTSTGLDAMLRQKFMKREAFREKMAIRIQSRIRGKIAKLIRKEERRRRWVEEKLRETSGVDGGKEKNDDAERRLVEERRRRLLSRGRKRRLERENERAAREKDANDRKKAAKLLQDVYHARHEERSQATSVIQKKEEKRKKAEKGEKGKGEEEEEEEGEVTTGRKEEEGDVCPAGEGNEI